MPTNTGPSGLPARIPEIVSQTEPAGHAPPGHHLQARAVWRKTGLWHHAEDMSQFKPENIDVKQVENTSRRGWTGKDLNTHSSGAVDQRDQMLLHKKCKEFHNLSRRQEEPVKVGAGSLELQARWGLLGRARMVM